MTLQPGALKAPIAVVGDQADCLTEIFRNEVNLAVWTRALRPEVTRFAEALTVSAGQLERLVCLADGDSAAMALPNWALELDGAAAWIADVDEVIAIERLATGAIGLLKGEAWEGNEGRGLVHRSPAPGDHPRLVLALEWL